MLLTVLVLLGVLNPGAGDAFRSADPPILGFSIERGESSPVYRLVDHHRGDAVLVIGGPEECQRRLVAELERKHGSGYLNVRFPTLGGKQFWEDLFVSSGWRIQRNVYSKHHRLLDSNDVRRAWGDFPACRTAFERFRLDQGLVLRSDHLVILVHGLGRSKDSFRLLGETLSRDGFEVASVNYPSTRRPVREHARQLAGIIGRTRGIRRVSFVTHSLGGIVVRDLLSGDLRLPPRIQIERVVMLAPPSRGSVLAKTLENNTLFKLMAGEVGQELTPEVALDFPSPPCEFGIIAGGRGDDRGFSPLLPGDDDGIVTVENTKLRGMKAFATVRAGHTFIMNHPEAIALTRKFLRHGDFGE